MTLKEKEESTRKNRNGQTHAETTSRWCVFRFSFLTFNLHFSLLFVCRIFQTHSTWFKMSQDNPSMTPMSYHSHLKRSLAHPWLAHARSSSYNTPFNIFRHTCVGTCTAVELQQCSGVAPVRACSAGGNSNLASDNIWLLNANNYTCSGVAPVRACSSGVTPMLREIIYYY